MKSPPPGSLYGFRPKKRLGQHFLLDPGVIRKIIACAGFQPVDSVVEIGPGKGALTLPMARLVRRAFAIEKDELLVRFLDKKLLREGITNVMLLHHDVLKWDFGELPLSSSTKIKVIGNLPYNISTPFLEKLIENRSHVNRAILMFQLEIGKRLTASPCHKAYGAMSVLVQYHAHATNLLEVSRGSFYPKPKVDSMVLELDFERPHPRRAVDEDKFRKVVKGAFSHRRKTLLNSLKRSFPFIDPGTLLRKLDACGINPGNRAETLTIDDFVCLSSTLRNELQENP